MDSIAILEMILLNYFGLYLLAGGVIIVLLVVLLWISFRKNIRYLLDVKTRDETIRELENTLGFNEKFQEKALVIISDLENSSQHLQVLFEDLCRLLQLKYAALVFQDDYAEEEHHFPFPKAFLDPVKVLEQHETFFSSNQNHLPQDLIVVDAHQIEIALISSLPTDINKVMIMPFVLENKICGSLLVCLNEEDLASFEEGIRRMWMICESLVTYTILRSEIAFRIEKASVVTKFLNKISAFNEVDKLLDSLHRFLCDHFHEFNITVFRTDEAGESHLRLGRMNDEATVYSLFPEAAKMIQKGKQLLYVPDRETLLVRHHLKKTAMETQAVLIVPLATMNEVMGFVVFECATQNPFKINTLSTLIRISEITSFFLKKLLAFKDELMKKEEEQTAIRKESASIQAVIKEQESTLKAQETTIREHELMTEEISNFNSVFSLVQKAQISVTNLRGFFKMMQESMTEQSQEAANLDWFRNCTVEVDRLENILKRFDLVRIITDKEFHFNTKEISTTKFLDHLFASLKSKMIIKKSEFEIDIVPGLQSLFIDVRVTSQAMQHFFNRLLDYISGGRFQFLVLMKSGLIQLIVKYNSDDPNWEKWMDRLHTKFKRELYYILLTKVISRQGGSFDLELSIEKGLILRIFFPEHPAS